MPTWRPKQRRLVAARLGRAKMRKVRENRTDRLAPSGFQSHETRPPAWPAPQKTDLIWRALGRRPNRQTGKRPSSAFPAYGKPDSLPPSLGGVRRNSRSAHARTATPDLPLEILALLSTR